MVDFREIINNLVDIGFYSVLLPFFLVYAVVYGILQKSNIFKSGDNANTNINAVIAFVFALFVVASIQTVKIIESFILNIIILIVFILTLLITLGFLFGDEYNKLFKGEDGKMNKFSMTIFALVFIVTLSILLTILGFWNWFGNWYDSLAFNNDIFSTIIVVGVIFGILYWITKSDSK